MQAVVKLTHRTMKLLDEWGTRSSAGFGGEPTHGDDEGVAMNGAPGRIVYGWNSFEVSTRATSTPWQRTA